MNAVHTKQMAFDWPSNSAASECTAAELLSLFDDWVAAGWLRSVDRAVAGLVLNQAPDVPPLALLAMVLASHQAGQGHVCLDLRACLADAASTLRMPPGEWRDPNEVAAPARTPANLLHGITLPDWLTALDACPEVIASIRDAAQSEPAFAPTESGVPPFVREQHRLYLRRYWRQEQAIVASVRARLVPDASAPEPIRGILDDLFAVTDRTPKRSEPDWQKIACAVAIRTRFALITGGPGTGKTTTVIKFLLLLQIRALAAGLPPRRIRLCAPTGKAAARLHQSIQGQMDALIAPFAATLPALRSALPDRVDTVHRLIGVRPNQTHPVYRAENPLPADVVVVDEASMIGIELMAKLLAALDPATQLVLLGDKDQLASVEPGAVLGELSSVIHADAYTAKTRAWIAATTGQTLGQILPVSDDQGLDAVALNCSGTALAQTAVQLQHSYRFDAASEIGALARCVNAGDAAGALTLLREQGHDASVQLIADGAEHQPLRRIVQAALAPWLAAVHEPMTAENQDERALAIFAAHQQAQVLCALRHGPYGVMGLNRWIEQLLKRSGALAVTGAWYAGRPVMITQNDLALRLANGEIGITLPYVDPDVAPDVAPDLLPDLLHGSPQSQPTLRVAFLNDTTHTDESPIRWILPSRLTACETAFALTVHKAQGSEFDHSVLVLPATPNPVLTRELIYTAITRARQRFTVVAAPTDTAFTVLRQGILRRVQRSGQLGAKLARLANGD